MDIYGDLKQTVFMTNGSMLTIGKILAIYLPR